MSSAWSSRAANRPTWGQRGAQEKQVPFGTLRDLSIFRLLDHSTLISLEAGLNFWRLTAVNIDQNNVW